MRRSFKTICSFAAFFSLLISAANAQKTNGKQEIKVPSNYTAPIFQNSTGLQTILESSIDQVLASFPSGTFNKSDISATLIDLREPNKIEMAELTGEKRIYPASVVKMFYMAALERQLEDGKIMLTPELTRGLRDMIVDSSNEATQYILDVVTDTSSGAELPQKKFNNWQYKRDRVNRFFAAMGYRNINANQKTFCEDAYGIEQQSRKYKGENRNMLTTNAVARLLTEIVLGRMNTPERTKIMMDLMKRDPFAATKDEEDQAHGFIGKALVDKKLAGAKLWSKAGWTSSTRHDAAYVETPDGLKFVLVIFTENHATQREAIPGIAGEIIDKLRMN